MKSSQKCLALKIHIVQSILTHPREELSNFWCQIADTASLRVSPRGGGAGRGMAPSKLFEFLKCPPCGRAPFAASRCSCTRFEDQRSSQAPALRPVAPFRRVHLPIPHSKLFEFLERLPFRQSFPAWRYPERSRIRGLTPETTQFFAGRRQNTLNYRNRQPLETFRMTSTSENLTEFR